MSSDEAAVEYGPTEDTTGCFEEEIAEQVVGYKSRHTLRSCADLAERLREMADYLEGKVPMP